MERGWRAVVLTHLLVLVALQAQNAQAAPRRAWGADVARGRAFPAPWLDSVLDPGWHPKEMHRETVPKEAVQKGSSLRVPVAGEEGEAMPERGMPEDGIGSDYETGQQDAGYVPWGHPRGADARKEAEAASSDELHKYYIPVTAAALALLLSGLVLSCVVILWLRRRALRTQKDEEAPGQASTDSARKSEDQRGDKGKAESGEETRKDEVANEKEIASRSSGPSPLPFVAGLTEPYRSASTEPSPLPACPTHSLTDTASVDTCISLDSPQPKPFWCPSYQHQQGYCTSEDEDFL